MKAFDTCLCDFTGYEISGVVRIKTWDGSIGFVKMTKAFIKAFTLGKAFDLSEEDIKKHINDGGFGCEKILNAAVIINALYNHDAVSFVDKKFIEVSEKITPEIITSFENYFNYYFV